MSSTPSFECADASASAGEIYKVVPPEVIRHPNGAVETIVAAFDKEVGGETVRVPIGRVVTEPHEQTLELPFVRESALAPTARVTGRAYRAKVYEEVNPVLYSSGRIKPNKHSPKDVAKNLRALEAEAAGVVLDYLGLEPVEQGRLERFKQRFGFGSAPNKAEAPTR